MLSSDQVPAKIEQVLYCSMSTQKSVGGDLLFHAANQRLCRSALVRKFGLGNCLVFFHLLEPIYPGDRTLVRHKFGLGFPALPAQ